MPLFTDALAQTSHKVIADDERQHPRSAFGRKAAILPTAGQPTANRLVVVIHNISRSGISFQHADRMKTQQKFRLELSSDGPPATMLECIVQRCEPGGTGGTQFVIGASFATALDAARVSEIVR